MNIVFNGMWTFAEQAQVSQNRCLELEGQLQAMKTKMGALQKQAAEHLASQTATPRKVCVCLFPDKSACCDHDWLLMPLRYRPMLPSH